MYDWNEVRKQKQLQLVWKGNFWLSLEVSSELCVDVILHRVATERGLAKARLWTGQTIHSFMIIYPL